MKPTYIFQVTFKWMVFLFSILLVVLPGAGSGQNLSGDSSISQKARENVGKAIAIQQESQEKRTRWAQEKSKMVLEYEQLLREKKALEKDNQALSARRDHMKAVNSTLEQQKKQSLRVARELLPFLQTAYKTLETFVENDTPFLREERTARLARLEKFISDPQISIAEKYRKTMEALFIEAEYGSTIEVYQDKVLMASAGDEQTLGYIFRLGRVSLFFLSLDKQLCGVFDPRQDQWQLLPDDMLPAIRSAVEIGSKRRPVELLPLPIGRLAGQEDAS
jgi:hypothetical protein